MSADKSQKNFDATPGRKEKAKREGNVARSSEVSALAAFGCAAITTFAAIPFIGANAVQTLREVCKHPDPTHVPVAFVATVGVCLLPIAAAAFGAVLAGLWQAGGLRLNMPKWQLARLHPGTGFKRMVGAEAIVGAVRAVIAFAIAAAAVWPILFEMYARSTGLPDAGAYGGLALDGARRACWATIGVGVVFALADYGLVRRRWLRDLKMTFEEIRRDQKENDGDPQARSRRKAMHRTFVRGAIARTKDASFVVVNPTHIAIAVRYAPPDVAVPEILVRAADDAALSVKALAGRHGIPIVENIALARQLYAQGEAGRAIPAAAFVAVARVIAALLREGALS